MSNFHGMPCWYELATNDLAGAAAFYQAVLGWNWSDSGTPGMTYMLGKAKGDMVAGMMQATAPQPVAWQIYFAVDNCDATVAQAVALGAQVYAPPMDIPNTGRFAVLGDPQGATFAILQPQPMENGETSKAFDQQKPDHGSWHEVICPDPAAALAFYGKLFGWTLVRSEPMGPDMTYHIIARGALEIGGAFAMAGAPPQWKPYFGMASAKASVAAVTAAGGRILHGPDEVPGNLVTLQIMDPQGATLALVGGA